MVRPPIPSELKPEQVVAVVDTREQLPLDLAPLQTVAGTLSTGDYSVRGLEHAIAIERKSLGDLLGCVGQHRERLIERCFYQCTPPFESLRLIQDEGHRRLTKWSSSPLPTWRLRRLHQIRQYSL